MRLEELERERMHLALGMAARAEGAKFAAAPMIKQRFGQDAARRVPGAQKKDVVECRGAFILRSNWPADRSSQQERSIRSPPVLDRDRRFAVIEHRGIFAVDRDMAPSV